VTTQLGNLQEKNMLNGHQVLGAPSSLMANGSLDAMVMQNGVHMGMPLTIGIGTWAEEETPMRAGNLAATLGQIQAVVELVVIPGILGGAHGLIGPTFASAMLHGMVENKLARAMATKLGGSRAPIKKQTIPSGLAMLNGLTAMLESPGIVPAAHGLLGAIYVSTTLHGMIKNNLVRALAKKPGGNTAQPKKPAIPSGSTMLSGVTATLNPPGACGLCARSFTMYSPHQSAY